MSATQEQGGAQPLWVQETRNELHNMRLLLQDASSANDVLGMRVDQMEHALKESNERWKKQQDQMDEMLELVREIKTSMKVANMLAKFIAWATGVALAVVGFWFTKGH